MMTLMMRMMTMSRPKLRVPKKTITLALPPNYLRYLKDLAERESRTCGGQVEVLIREYAIQHGEGDLLFGPSPDEKEE